MILIFGESQNDSDALRQLVLGLCPGAAGKVKVRRTPPSLSRSAGVGTVRTHADKVAALVRAEGVPVTCVLVHSDADGPDPAGRLADERTAALLAAGVDCAHAVVPVHEMEAWWLLFPAAVERAFPSWKGALSRKSADVETQANPKEHLRRLTRSKNAKRPYSEADGPRIAAEIASLGPGAEPTGRSVSFARFRETVDACCIGLGASAHADSRPARRRR